MRTQTDHLPSFFAAPVPGDDPLAWICIAKGIRTFALSGLSIVLVVFLLARGFSVLAVGAIFSATVAEDAIVTTLVATLAARLGMRRVLTWFSLLMIVSGLILAFSHLSWAIAAAAVFGVISPAGYEGGPFGAIEQTIISKSVPANRLAKALSWYHLAGFAGAAVGALVTGAAVAIFNAQHYNFAYEGIFSSYAVAGMLLLAIYRKLNLDCCERNTVNQRSAPISPMKKVFPTGIPKQVWKMSALQGLDSFGGGFVTTAIVAYWFYASYHAGAEFFGPLCFWGNVVAAASFIMAPAFVKRFGLLNTMVFTHLPCSLALCLIPLMPTAALAGLVILLRCMFSSMDIPARQAFTMLIVAQDERPVAVAVIDSTRAIAQGIAPVICGAVMSNPVTGLPFFLAGLCKSTYDLSLYFCFRHVVPERDLDSPERVQAPVSPVAPRTETVSSTPVKLRELVGSGSQR